MRNTVVVRHLGWQCRRAAPGVQAAADRWITELYTKAVEQLGSDKAPIYIILDNLSAHRGQPIRSWVARSKVELCFTPTYSSWVNPIEAHFGPLRTVVIAGSDHHNHPVLTQRLRDYLCWRNTNSRHPGVLAAQRRERARFAARRVSAGAGNTSPQPPGQPSEPTWTEHQGRFGRRKGTPPRCR
ncbi:transposase [Amycolatopsis keratiniphila]|uniref:transposase n=1 Tax=Amycolatopsis keratiniphila TaxID=129921 RepID=UPI0033EA2597